MSLIKLTVLNDDAVEVELIPEDIRNLSDSFLQVYKSTITGTPSHYCKYGDFVYLRPCPNYSETEGLRVYFNRPASKFDFATFTVTIASPGVVTATAHGLVANDTVMLETDGALPTGLSADTVYYLVATVATDTFSLALTKGGTAITTSGSQSGIHYFVETSKVPGIPEIHHSYLAKYASLPFLIEKSLPQMGAVASQIAIDEKAITEYFARRNKDQRNKMTMRIPMGR